MINNKFELSNKVLIPSIGFGTWQIPPQESYKATSFALKVGYRHIDTALAYENEEGVGKAIKDSGIDRKDIFVTTKCPADIKTYEKAKEAFMISLKNLGLEYIDLYLIHAPWPWSNVGSDCKDGNVEVWKAMIEFYNKGLIKAIGVSNFSISDIEYLIEKTNFKPMVNQIRYFIGNTQETLTKYCQDNNILVEAYSPLATGNLLTNKTLIEMACKYNVTVGQLCIRYCIEKNTLPLPKSVNEGRIIENTNVNFKISKGDIEILDKIHNKDLDRPFRT